MKSEHRHELAENDLSKLIDRGRDRVEPHLNKILLGLLVATVVIVGGIAIFRSQGSTSTVGAAELAAAATAAEYDKVADDFAGTTVGLWARLRAGEEHLREGVRLSLTNRSASNDSLEAAQQAFQQVLRGDNVQPEMREKALYGLAVGLESLTSEQTTTRPAIEAYQQLLTAFPDSRFKPQAEARIRALEKPSAGEFYAWFHSQNPKPADRPLPRDFPELPLGNDFNPFQGMDPPADMPADATPSGTSDAAEPESETQVESPAPTSSDAEAAPVLPEPSAPADSATEPPSPTPESGSPDQQSDEPSQP